MDFLSCLAEADSDGRVLLALAAASGGGGQGRGSRSGGESATTVGIAAADAGDLMSVERDSHAGLRGQGGQGEGEEKGEGEGEGGRQRCSSFINAADGAAELASVRESMSYFKFLALDVSKDFVDVSGEGIDRRNSPAALPKCAAVIWERSSVEVGDLEQPVPLWFA